jgi:phage baseplate assembly protein gpV
MRRLAFFVLFSILVTAPFAMAGEWTKTYTLNGRPDLKVVTSDAAVRVSTWNRNTIEARVTTEGYKIGDNGIRITEHQTGNTVELEVRYPHEHVNFSFGWNHHRVEIAILMPREGRANLRTGDGSIRVNGLKGEMDVDTGDGSVEVTDVDGTLKARTGDGHIRVTGRFDLLNLDTGDGRIEATLLPGSKVSQNWNVHTGDGSVTLRIPENLAADLDLHTSDGHIRYEVPITSSGNMAEHTLRGRMNGGGNLVTIHTGDGSITIEKS